MFRKYKNINKEELYELQEINRIIIGEKWKLLQIQENTALIPEGQKLKEQLEKVIEVLEKKKFEHIGQLLAHLGYPPKVEAMVNFKTGKITIVNDRTTDSQKDS